MPKYSKWLIVLIMSTYAGLCLAEASSTVSLGLGRRNIKSLPAKRSDTDTTRSEETIENFTDPLLAYRISVPSRLGVEIGAGGYAMFSKADSFVHSIGANMMVLWYPLASLGTITDDAGLGMKREIFASFYTSLIFGLSKTTHVESNRTVFSLSTDYFEFGGGIGWLYSINPNLSLGVEGFYTRGLVMSKGSTGEMHTLAGAGVLTIKL